MDRISYFVFCMSYYISGKPGINITTVLTVTITSISHSDKHFIKITIIINLLLTIT